MPKLSPKHTNVPGVLSKSFLGAKAKQKTPSLMGHLFYFICFIQTIFDIVGWKFEAFDKESS